jgi:hypothetical protein
MTAIACAARIIARTIEDDRDDTAARAGARDVMEDGIGGTFLSLFRDCCPHRAVKWRRTSVLYRRGASDCNRKIEKF